MATTTGPDLSGGLEAIEALMDDECVITRDVAGSEDGVLDQDPLSPTFGQLVQAEPITIYEGQCLFKAPSGLSNRPQEEGGRLYTRGEYEIRLPLSFLESNPDAEPRKGDDVTATSTRRDPELVGKEFRIIDVVYKTMAVARACSLERRD